MTDSVVINSTPTTGAPEGHDQKMMDLVDSANSIQTENFDPPADSATDSVDRPQWLPEKFKTPEDMAKAYAELESKIGKAPEKSPEEKPLEIPDPAKASDEEVSQTLTERGLNMDDFSNEFSQNGELSADSYKKLEAAGIPKATVDLYIEGQKALSTQYESTVKSEVGGDENYIQMVTWAKSNLTPSEISAFNNAVGSGSIDQAKLAVLGLQAKYSSVNGNDPKRTVGGNRATSDDRFESTAQLTEAMRDPRYKNDPAYRATVQSKLSRSSVF